MSKTDELDPGRLSRTDLARPTQTKEIMDR